MPFGTSVLRHVPCTDRLRHSRAYRHRRVSVRPSPGAAPGVAVFGPYPRRPDARETIDRHQCLQSCQSWRFVPCRASAVESYGGLGSSVQRHSHQVRATWLRLPAPEGRGKLRDDRGGGSPLGDLAAVGLAGGTRARRSLPPWATHTRDSRTSLAAAPGSRLVRVVSSATNRLSSAGVGERVVEPGEVVERARNWPPLLVSCSSG
jgi:hypothetical protein